MYKIKAYIPSLSAFNNINELNNSQYITINKYIAANNNEGLAEFFETLLPDSAVKLYDKFFILIYLRMLSIGNEVKLKYSENNGYSASLSVYLNKLLEKLLQTYPNNIPPFCSNELKITFKQPTKLYYKNIFNLLYDIIEDIDLNTSLNDYKSLKSEIKRQIISRFKVEVLDDIKAHLKLHSNDYFLSVIEDKEIFKINLYTSSVLKLLKLLYKNNLSNIYLKLYYCSQKIGISYSDYCNITPSEVDLLLSIYKSANNIK